MSRLFTSESVTEGHPDKVADSVSDAVLDALLAQDIGSRVAVETLVTTGTVHVAGEVTTAGYVDIARLARERILQIGYDSSDKSFDGASCGVLVSIGAQSPDIAQGVNDAGEHREGGSGDALDSQGAGDQGLMFGYATNETPEMMPLPITIAHRLCKQLADERRASLGYLRPDGKAQVTVTYRDGLPSGINTVVVSSQHAPDIDNEQLRADITERVIKPVLGDWWHEDLTTFINPTGLFVVGGPMGDAGLTGRKIIVDTYGGMARHGGGAFSGKDPSKVDRSACYAARWVAKNVVAAGLADRCEVQVAYAIGVAHPVSVMVECFGTETRPIEQIEGWVAEKFDLRPAAIIEHLDLRRPIYSKTAAYGHFGRNDPDFTWENTDIGQAYAS